MGIFRPSERGLIWQENQQIVWLQPWGPNGIRVRANLAGAPLDIPQALLDLPPVPDSEMETGSDTSGAWLRNGSIKAAIASNGRIQFFNARTGAVLLQEPSLPYYAPPNRHFKPKDGRLYQLEAWFEARDGERFFGLGQHQHGKLDNKGCVIDMQQRNTEVAIPFMISNQGYGFLWNNPGIGRVELGVNATRWVAYGSQQIDYYVVCGDSYAEILRRYADATGHSPVMPAWATGFWQCKLRYETQDELMAVAREYHKRGLPLSVIVSDFFNWPHMGEWRFDPACWPDPTAMTRELESMGVKLMVSIWPTVSTISENIAAMRERGLLVNNERGTDAQQVFVDHGINGPAYFPYYDATNPEARQFIWDVVKRNYYAQGVKLFWLDNDEPDITPWDPDNLRFFLGNGLEVGNIYPKLHQMAFYDGLHSAGETEVVTLSRSAWAGSQRYSSINWSGDVASTFEALQAQVRAGLNMAMSGIPWWTTDIGGFHDGDITTDIFKELIVRWFQYGVFCPIFRLHGDRSPRRKPFPDSGGDNEIWSFGEPAYAMIKPLLFLREALRPYIQAQMERASVEGLPPMRPMFVDFNHDKACEAVEDQFMFGPDILVAPILAMGQRERDVYLPAGTDWLDAWTGQPLTGGQVIKAAAPLDRIPVYLRLGSSLLGVFRS